MKYIYITNSTDKAKIADDNGVNFVMIDLEINGKEERQGHLNTLISRHSMSDIQKVKKVLSNSELLVRVNPIFEGSKEEIEQAITSGADMLMLPMFERPSEVKRFIDYIDGRAKVCLLFETPNSLIKADQILSLKGIDQVHFGLNDMHLAMNLDFMFELLSSGVVEFFADKCKKYDVLFGFGGIAPIGKGKIDSSYIANEHYRIGSKCVILSRDFHAKEDKKDLEREIFESNFLILDRYFQNIALMSTGELLEIKDQLGKLILEVVYKND